MKTNNVRGFTAGQASKATGVPYHQINYWAKTGVIEPGVTASSGSETCRVYRFQDLVALRIARDLRDSGIDLRLMKKLAEAIQAKEFDGAADEDLFFIGGAAGEVEVIKGRSLADLLRQRAKTAFVWIINLASIVDELREAIVTVRRPARGKACAVV